MEIDISSKITGKNGSVEIRPGLELKVTLEQDKDDGTIKLWFEGPNKDLRGPVGLSILNGLPIGTKDLTMTMLPIIEVEKIRELFFALSSDLPDRIVVFLWFMLNGETRYLEGIIWDTRALGSNRILDLKWLVPKKPKAMEPYKRLEAVIQRRLS